MSNFIYTKAKQAILNGEINFSQDVFRLLFVNQNYSPNQTLHEYVSDVSNSAIVQRSSNLTNVSNNNGVIDADDVTFTLDANTGFSSIILFQAKNLDQESRLIAYIDTVEGLPYSGSAVPLPTIIVWSNLAGKILSI